MCYYVTLLSTLFLVFLVFFYAVRESLLLFYNLLYHNLRQKSSLLLVILCAIRNAPAKNAFFLKVDLLILDSNNLRQARLYDGGV